MCLFAPPDWTAVLQSKSFLNLLLPVTQFSAQNDMHLSTCLHTKVACFFQADDFCLAVSHLETNLLSEDMRGEVCGTAPSQAL